MKILIIEDNVELNNMLGIFFKDNGLEVSQAYNRKQGLEVFYKGIPDLIILDVNLPDGNGMDICKELKSVSEVPILMLTANSSFEDEIRGLKNGADDYITKPFNFEILNLRVKSLLKRKSTEEIKIGKNMRILPSEYKVYVDNEQIKLSPKEYDLLMYLYENKKMFSSREVIINHIWGFDYYGDLRTVDTHVNRLKKKVINSGVSVENKRGRGYRLIDED